MLRVLVRQARPGMTLARAVINPRYPDTTLLSAGYTLNSPEIARLHEIGVYDLWVDYPGLDFLDEMISPRLSVSQQRLCETLKSSFHHQAQQSESALPIFQYKDVVRELVESILESASSMPFMTDLAGVDDSLLRHSSEVCVLGVMLGLKLDAYIVDQRRRIAGHVAKDIVNLGIGCMLHDIGELQLPERLRESRRLEGDESVEWKQHVTLGYKAVRGQLEPSAANVVLHHHQHFDGTGFPVVETTDSTQCASQIHVFARIAMAADMFQHLLVRDGMNYPTVSGLWRVQQRQYRSWFDPVVLATLLSVVQPFLPGMVVQLTDRRFAIVSRVHEQAPCYPEVQVLNNLDLMSKENTSGERETVDLSMTQELAIQGVDGFEVSKYLYGPRRVHVKLKTVATVFS